MQLIATDGAPAAIGPYSQGVVAAGLVFTAGQIPLDPATGELVDGDIAAQTTRVMQNLAAVLAAAGSGLDRVVKTTIYLADMADFAAMNAAYADALGDHRPARSTFAVKTLPKNARVEIDAVALAG